MDIKQLILKYQDDKYLPLMLRLNVAKEKEEVMKDLLTNENYEKVIVAQESAARKHFHVMIITKETDSKNARQNLRNLLKRLYEVDGNKDFSIPENIKKGTESTMSAYIVKDDNYVSHGYTEKELEVFKKISYKKYNSREFQEELNKINALFISDHNLEIDWWIKKYTQLKVDYNQNLNVNTIVNYLNLINAKKYGTSEIVNAIKNKFENQTRLYS